MFRVMLYSQWKWSRLTVLLGSVAGFALPLTSVHGAARADSSPLQAPELLHAVPEAGVCFVDVAGMGGVHPQRGLDVVTRRFGARQIRIENRRRGPLTQPTTTSEGA